jgi:hypothetical protein
MTLCEWSPETVSAIGTVAGAVIAFLALIAAIPMLVEARRARKVTLSITLSERFSSDEMHEALAYLGQRRDQYHFNITDVCDAYVAEAKVANQNGEVSAWDRNRRVVSKFFIAAFALCKEKLLEPNVFAEQIGRASIELFVNIVSPLNEAQAIRVQGRSDFFDPRVRNFFTDFLDKHFRDNSGDGA